MGRDFFPRREADIVTWSRNFAEKISAEPEQYGLTPLLVAQYLDRQEAFFAAFQTVHNPATRTPVAMIGKEETRVALEAEARKLARIIRATPTVTVAQRIELGLSAHEPGRRGPAVPRPEAAPSVWVVSVTGRTVKMQLMESANSPNRHRPRGAAGATIFAHVGEQPPPPTSDQWRFMCNTTRTAVEVTFADPTLAPGTRVWLLARWFNTRAEPGPPSRPAYAHLQYGVMLPGSLAA